ncbi:MAG: fasciclin domain-containing protein, partial [Solirubrobacteraceae bacterium]|nr:fasciclin domain-containing protein [Solirubrobacteraceae bacterium]
MRTPSFALVSATVALSLLAAGCGDDEPNVTETAAPPAATTAPPAGGEAVTPGAEDNPATPPQGSTEPSDETITQSVAANGDLTSLNTAVGAAGLGATLEQPGPYTVFAPNNDAFAKLGSQLDTLLQPASKAKLANILKFHVVSGELKVKDLKDKDLLTTLQGTRLRVSVKGNTVTLGNSQGDTTVVAADTDASNGVVHMVDT